MRLFSTDLVLLHPPAVWDFRRHRSLFGPVSDVVLSSPVFEMYPVGLTSLAGRLEEAGFNVRLINVAYRMLRDPDYEPERALAPLHPLAFGIDLHWLLHANGALELARRLKRLHPEIPVVFGGLSASYFHEELIRYPQVDLVMRGDSTEAPMVALMRALASGVELDDVPNLVWKDGGGQIRRNAMAGPPADLAGVPLPDYRYVIRSVLKYGSLADVVPYVTWREYPMAGVLTSRGCRFDCTICGGGRTAYRRICDRAQPAFRPPEELAEDVQLIGSFSRGPIIFLNDVRMAGTDATARLWRALAARRVRNELVFELFGPAGDEFFGPLAESVPRFSVQLSLESHRPLLRRRFGKFACDNDRVEATLASALAHGVGRIDVFFMVGLPGQTRRDAVEAIDYCRALLQRFPEPQRLRFFVAPLTPFLDPGSPAFEAPEAFGYRIRMRRLEDYRVALTRPTWKQMLNYETDALSRDAIVDATYECYDRLAALERDHGLINASEYADRLAHTRAAREIIAEVDEALALPPGPARGARLEAVRRRIGSLAEQASATKENLRWPVRRRWAPPWSMGREVGVAAVGAVRLLLRRRMPLLRRSSPRRLAMRDPFATNSTQRA